MPSVDFTQPILFFGGSEVFDIVSIIKNFFNMACVICEPIILARYKANLVDLSSAVHFNIVKSRKNSGPDIIQMLGLCWVIKLPPSPNEFQLNH